MLRALKLPAFAAHYGVLAVSAEKEGIGFDEYLKRLCETEMAQRAQRKTERLLKMSGLPKDKTLATLNQGRLTSAAKRQLPPLCTGDFADKGENVLVFGLPGRGKTHYCCAIAYELIRKDRSVMFTPTYKLVQHLLAAKPRSHAAKRTASARRLRCHFPRRHRLRATGPRRDGSAVPRAQYGAAVCALWRRSADPEAAGSVKTHSSDSIRGH